MTGRRANGEGNISQRPDGTWEAKVSLGQSAEGKRRRKSVYGKTKKEVRAKLDEIKQQVASGTYAYEQTTVSAFLERWLKDREHHLKHRTVLDYQYDIQKYINPHLGGARLDRLTPLQVQDMLNTIAKAVSPDRANKARRILLGALKQAVRWQLIPRNPVEATDPMKHTRRPQQVWTPQETAQFLGTTQGHKLLPPVLPGPLSGPQVRRAARPSLE